MLKCFEESSRLKFNDGSVVFFFDDDQYDDWMKALAKHIAPPTNINKSEVNLLFSTDGLEIPEHPDHGKLTASLYYKPKKDGKSKIMLQGAAHLAFLSFVIPTILKESIYKKAPEPKDSITDVETKEVESKKDESAKEENIIVGPKEFQTIQNSNT